MGWIQYGTISDDDGEQGDEQIGNVSSVRLVNPSLPGRLVTVYAYPAAPEILGGDCPHKNVILERLGENVARYAPMPDEHVWCTHDRDGLRVDITTEFMICGDVGDPGNTEKWCDYRYETVDTKPIKHLDNAQGLARTWVRMFNADRDIHWDGKPF